MPVIVELFADGTGRWSSIPDDWYVASMGVGDVLLARNVNGGLELARLSYTENTGTYPVQLCHEGTVVGNVQHWLFFNGADIAGDGSLRPDHRGGSSGVPGRPRSGGGWARRS